MPTTDFEAALQPGDLVFINVQNFLYRRVGVAIGSKATHVGIAFRSAHGEWTVAESTVPFAKHTPLRAFLGRSHAAWFAVRRLHGGLTAAQTATLRAECDRRMGGLYHLGFNYDSRRLFCSKLVFDAYRAAASVEAGTLETFGDLLRRQPDASLKFWKLWFLGRIPWSRRTVTPASQLTAAGFDTVAMSPNSDLLSEAA